MSDAGTIKLLYDGLCPVCVRKMNDLRKLDRGRERLIFEDMTRPEFDPERYGMTQTQALKGLHAVRSDGSMVHGMEAVRSAYRAVGRGRIWGLTGWPVIRPLFDLFYRLFARFRPRRAAQTATACRTGACEALHD